jgi:hypothetical protein
LPIFLTQEKVILKQLSEYPIPRAKTTLSALFIVSGNDAYRSSMVDLCKEDNEVQLKQEATEKQKESWITQEDVKEKWEELYKKAKPMLEKKANPDFTFFNAFMLFSIMSGIFIPPRRNPDYCDMFIRGKFDKINDNWYNDKTGIMCINNYKTKKFYGEYVVNLKEMSPELYTLLKKWCSINKTNWLFFNQKGEGINSTIINHYNEKIWNGKEVICNSYRHSYISHFYSGQMPSLESMQELSKAMGHNIIQGLLYVKRDMPL